MPCPIGIANAGLYFQLRTPCGLYEIPKKESNINKTRTVSTDTGIYLALKCNFEWDVVFACSFYREKYDNI